MVDRLEGYVLLWRKESKIVSVGSQVVGRVSIIITITMIANLSLLLSETRSLWRRVIMVTLW